MPYFIPYSHKLRYKWKHFDFLQFHFPKSLTMDPQSEVNLSNTLHHPSSSQSTDVTGSPAGKKCSANTNYYNGRFNTCYSKGACSCKARTLGWNAVHFLALPTNRGRNRNKPGFFKVRGQYWSPVQLVLSFLFREHFGHVLNDYFSVFHPHDQIDSLYLT